MSRFIGPRLRVIKKLGDLPAFSSKLFVKSSFFLEKVSKKKKNSEFFIRLREKQRIKFNYALTERQLFNYLVKAKKKKVSTGLQFLSILEMRLDNILFRSGFFSTILFARQVVTHGHVLVNNLSVTFPSFSCKPLDTISIKNFSDLKKKNYFSSSSRFNSSFAGHLLVDVDFFTIQVVNSINKKFLLFFVNELLVVEFYSKKL